MASAISAYCGKPKDGQNSEAARDDQIRPHRQVPDPPEEQEVQARVAGAHQANLLQFLLGNQDHELGSHLRAEPALLRRHLPARLWRRKEVDVRLE